MTTQEAIIWLENKIKYGERVGARTMVEVCAMAVSALQAQIEQPKPSAWIPADTPPKNDGVYIVKTATGSVTTAHYYAPKVFPATKKSRETKREGQWQSNRRVVEWMPLPK